MRSTSSDPSVAVASTKALLTPRSACFLLLALGSIAWFWTPLARVIGLSLDHGQHEHHSHIVVMPFASAFVLYRSRRAIFSDLAWAPAIGAALITAGMVSSGSAPLRLVGIEPSALLSQGMLALVTVVLGAFVLCYGVRAFRRGAFGLLLLYLMVPIPPSMLDATVGFLQRASADAADVLFGVVGAPVHREGLMFQLPRLTIVVAEECSGIRSSLALLVCSLVAGHLSLRSAWAKGALVAAVLPLAVIKNAVRIVALSLLAIYVDPSFITDSVLHKNGGIPLFALSLAAVCGLVWLLRRLEIGLAHRGAARRDREGRRPLVADALRLDGGAGGPRAASKGADR